MPLEIELKLAIAPADVAKLRRHPLLKGVKSSRRRLYGIYFDTPDFRLYRRRGAFRLRREGYHWVQTVKLDSQAFGGLSSRPEWEVQVTGNRPDLDALPGEARAYIDPDVAAALAPVFVTDIQRTTWLLTLPAGTVEVALDRGRIHTEHAAAGGDGGEVLISEVELELKAGDPAILFDLALDFLEVVPLRPEARSKALRGYALAGGHAEAPCKAVAAEIDPHLPAAEAWRRMVLAGLRQFGHNLPGFLVGEDPEYLHQLRVAVRRMGTLLRVGPAAAGDHADWRTELAWLMGELSPARDWDVMVTETLAAVQVGVPRPERLDGLVAVAGDMRALANRRARAAVVDPRCTRLLLEMGRGLLQPHDAGEALPVWERAVMDKRWRRFRRLAGRFAKLDPEGRHQLRISAKRLRYAGEIFAALHGKAAQRFLKRLSRLQDRLGVANDAAVAHALLESLVDAGELAGAIGLVDGYLASRTAGGMKRMAGQVKALRAGKPFWR